MVANFQEMRSLVDSILAQVGNEDAKVEDKLIRELLRYSDSQLHTVSAFLGGVASQEAIKLLIRQYTPLNHTLVYNGIQGKCQVFNA